MIEVIKDMYYLIGLPINAWSIYMACKFNNEVERSPALVIMGWIATTIVWPYCLFCAIYEIIKRRKMNTKDKGDITHG